VSDNLPTTVHKGTMNLVPTTFESAMQIAVALAKSSMVPNAYRGKPEDVFAAMEMGSRLGFGPMQSVQNISNINGRPSVFGDGFMAVIRGFPDFAGCDEDNAAKAEKQGFGRCKLRRRMTDGSIQEVEETVTVEMAKKAGWWGKQGPWSSTPGRMLQWRARSWAGRGLFPDRLCGLTSAEEAADIVDTTATVVDMMPTAKPAEDDPPVDATPSDDIPFNADEPSLAAGEVLVTVTAVDVATGVNQKTGKPWTKYGVRVDNGDTLGTFSSTVGDLAKGLVGKRAAVLVESQEVNGKTYFNLKAIRGC